jgi:hypothetical protein
MINSRRMRWSGHAAQMREKRKRESWKESLDGGGWVIWDDVVWGGLDW